MINEPVRIRDLAKTFFVIGLTAYGGPAIVAQIRRAAVLQHRWLTEEEFAESLAFCQTIPGAIAVQTAAHVGWRLSGPVGALVATVAYILPAFLLMLGLSALYVRLGEVPIVETLLQGLRAVVVAIVLDSILSMARPALKDWRGVLLAAGAAIALIFHAGALLVLLGSALASIALLRDVRPEGGRNGSQTVKGKHGWREVAAILLVGSAIMGAIAFSGHWNRVLIDLAVTMAKVDMLAFGGGYTAVGLMHDQVMTAHRWLTAQEFLDGLALGQLTPGPIILTATFIGYKVAGLAGALVATIGILMPSWLLLALVAPQFERVRSLALVHRMIRGLLAAFVAMLVYVLWQVGIAAFHGWVSGVLAAVALVALRLKVPPLWVVGGSIVVSAIMFAFK